MLQILARTNLVHQLVLVTVHACQLSNVVEGVENSVSKLESINVTQPVLNLSIDNELGQTQNLTHKVESVSKARLLALLGGQGLDRLEVEVVVQMQVGQVLTVNQEVQHVEALPADLQTSFNPVNGRLLEELGTLQAAAQILFVLCFCWFLVQLVQDVRLQKLLVRDSDLHGLALRGVLKVPLFYKGHVLSADHLA